VRALLFAALLAATCQHGDPTGTGPTPPPVPWPVPDGGDDSGEPVVTPAPVPDPSAPETQCETAWAVQADAECAPAIGHDASLTKCSKLPTATVACVMSVESCAAMRNCLGDF
jgi:hypothetical protein